MGIYKRAYPPKLFCAHVLMYLVMNLFVFFVSLLFVCLFVMFLGQDGSGRAPLISKHACASGQARLQHYLEDQMNHQIRAIYRILPISQYGIWTINSFEGVI